MSVLETEPAAMPAETGEAPEPVAAEQEATGNGAAEAVAREPKSEENEEVEASPLPDGPARRRRAPPYTRSFRGFLEQLGENTAEFDTFRRGYWSTFKPADAFEDDLVDDLVENRWKVRRLTRTHQAKLVEIRRRKELQRERRLASEGREEGGAAAKWLMTTEGLTGLPDSKYKFEHTTLFLRGLRATVESEGFTEWGAGCLRVIFGENPGLCASDVVREYKAGMKADEDGDEEAQQLALRSFLSALDLEIVAYQKLHALYREGAIEIPEATRDAQMLLDEKDLDNMLRQERLLELEYQLKLEQLSAWRRGKGAGVLDFDSAPGSASRRLAAGGGSVARRPGRPPSLAGAKP